MALVAEKVVKDVLSYHHHSMPLIEENIHKIP